MIDLEFWPQRRVFLTGHTGFKGGWLSHWLLDLGSDVTGFALEPDTDPAFFHRTRLGSRMTSLFGDIRDRDSLRIAMRRAEPEVVFHLAAQPLVRRSYREPAPTFETNVMGTVNVLESVRACSSVRAVIVVTSDKCYEATDDFARRREDDPLGGSDPYSASKGCAEIVTRAYARSFFADGARASLASVRAGNVFGGGDWAEDRLVPDAVRALASGEPLVVRNPEHVRPWQHVLDPLAGYLRLAERLHGEGGSWAGAWNFGPREDDAVPVSRLADLLVAAWGSGSWRSERRPDDPPETTSLQLDCSKARNRLGWRPRLALDEAVELTVRWYRDALASTSPEMTELTTQQLKGYQSR